MSIPGYLYDATDSPPMLIATVALTTESRATYVAVPNKLDEGWPGRAGGTVELRVRAEGVTSLNWIAALYARQDARAAAPYQVAFMDGDGHAGSFVVEELTEIARTDDGRRRFRLTLLSHERVTYSPAP